MTLEEYVSSINQRFKLGNATEHTFRGDLQQLLEALVPEIRATNEPKRQKCGAPDYILTKNDIAVGFIEAKNIGNTDLEGKKKTGNKEQFDRYKNSLNNIIFTDYLNFYFYLDGELKTQIKIAKLIEVNSSSSTEIFSTEIVALPEYFDQFKNLITDFCTQVTQTIKNPKRLAELMAGKARLLSDIIGRALTSDETHNEDSTLKEQMAAFKSILIHDITQKGFADVYAQTIAYGLFAARLHDPTLNTFSRQEAAELIPKSNPFLRKLFGYIAGPDIDDRIKWIVDNLVEIFLACNVEEILKDYGKSTKMEDPIIHFYETFLAEYDPKLRKARGVWYTPAPVVNFIVRAVDDILKSEFDLPQGLADTSKTKIKVNLQSTDKRYKENVKTIEEDVHKIQILDPATGTGTFLAEVIKHIHKKFKGQEGVWSSYVEDHLLPRLNGFELLMASYAMAHLKMDLLLSETGFKATKSQRTRIYLTNSLEEYHKDAGTLFASWLSTEANEANHIKRDTPVMCIIGNPPYAVSSANKGEWIESLIADYKKDLNEKSYNSLSDDYVKFIRYGQHFIDKNNEGVLAFISNNSFIDGIVFRQMRKNLLESFDKIFILDLHGNSKKKEVTPDGFPDQNVFDIMQGVSINIFIKTGQKKKNNFGKVYNFNLQGKRDFKYKFLTENSFSSIPWEILTSKNPNFFFVSKNLDAQAHYNKHISINELFIKSTVGVSTFNDNLTVKFNREDLIRTINFIKENNDLGYVREKLNIKKDSRDWKLSNAIEDLMNYSSFDNIEKVFYRPFDWRYTLHTNKSKGFIAYPRPLLVNNLLLKDNLSFNTVRQSLDSNNTYSFITKDVICRDSITSKTYGSPLYLYPEQNNQLNIGDEELTRSPNLDPKIVAKIAKGLGLTFVNEKPFSVTQGENNKQSELAPIDLLDYIYAVLHSPNYRETYKEFLKIDFPRVPYPKDKSTFWKLVKLGSEIRQIHLLESPKVEDYITTYPISGSNVVTTKIAKKDWELFDEAKGLGRIWINDEQYFENIPLVAWEFYIGGYQPAQKWLKDRKERTLEYEDILHYQKIIVALAETDRLMKEIDKIDFE